MAFRGKKVPPAAVDTTRMKKQMQADTATVLRDRANSSPSEPSPEQEASYAHQMQTRGKLDREQATLDSARAGTRPARSGGIPQAAPDGHRTGRAAERTAPPHKEAREAADAMTDGGRQRTQMDTPIGGRPRRTEPSPADRQVDVDPEVSDGAKVRRAGTAEPRKRPRGR